MAENSQRRRQFLAGLRTGGPVLLGYLPVSFAFAVWAVGNGLPWQMVLLISMTNFTSAGQQAGAGLLAAGAGLPEIGVTVLVINIRYMLMSLSLSQKMLRIPVLKRLLLANGVTDEIFFLAMREKGQLSGWFFTGLSVGPYAGWVLGTLGGALAGAVLPVSFTSPLGIALFAMFIAIVMPAARGSRAVAVVTLTAVALRCIFQWVPLLNRVPSGWALIICAVAASVMGAWRFPVPETDDEKEAAA